MRQSSGRWLLIAILAALLMLPPAVQASFPGQNGKIAFSGGGTSKAGLFTVDPDGANETLLGPGLFPAWSADGTKLAFTDVTDGNFDVYRANADGSGRVRLTTDPARDDDAAWSPDGTEIVFTSGRSGSPELYVMDANGGAPTRLTFFGQSTFAYEPAWSPKGDKIAFYTSELGGSEHVHVMNVDGTRDTVLPQDGSIGQSPDWSPDGARIIFRSNRDGIFDAFYTMKADGTAVTRVGDIADGDFVDDFVVNRAPKFSPDGTKIVFTYTDCLFTLCSGGVVTADPDGTNQKTIWGGRFSYDADWQPLPNRPPDCSAVTATPGFLWPPNHKLSQVTLSGATDPDGDAVVLTVTGVTGGATRDAVIGPAASQVRLRSTRGRSYRIAFDASDGKGGTCAGTAAVAVEHHP